MIDPFNLRQVRTVELLGNQTGIKINNFVMKGGEDSDLLEPLRAAIGMRLVTSLMLNEESDGTPLRPFESHNVDTLN
jgi:hypothetical protein